jgi:hypothetical protein
MRKSKKRKKREEEEINNRIEGDWPYLYMNFFLIVWGLNTLII